MEVAVPCLVCKTILSCECQSHFVRYFELLEKAYERVLRAKPASTESENRLISAGIDKLNMNFEESIGVQKVIDCAKSLGLPFKVVHLKSKKPFLQVGEGEQVVHLSLYQDLIIGLSSNPNRFGNWSSYMNQIEKLLTQSVLIKARIVRLDLNMDFSSPFDELIQRIDIKNKSTAISFDDKRGIRTGINIGKAPELITIYDKSRQNGSSFPRTRVELRLSASKIPSRSIYKIPDLLRSKSYFESIKGVELHFNNGGFSEEQTNRISEFRTTLKRDGYYSARKTKNLTRNFDRDFKNLISIHPWRVQPFELFKGGIERFLEHPHEESKTIH